MKQSFQQQAVQEELPLQSIAGKQTFPAGMHILATVRGTFLGVYRGRCGTANTSVEMNSIYTFSLRRPPWGSQNSRKNVKPVFWKENYSLFLSFPFLSCFDITCRGYLAEAQFAGKDKKIMQN